MIGDGRSGLKAFFAVVTYVGFFAGMRRMMNRVLGQTARSETALFANDFFLTAMFGFVKDKRVHSRQFFAALFAR